MPKLKIRNTSYFMWYFLLLISSFMLVKIYIFSLFFIFQLIIFGNYLMKKGKFPITKENEINAVAISYVLSMLVSLASGITLSYKKAAIIAVILVLPIYFTYCILKHETNKDPNLLNIVTKGIVATCSVEVIWCLIQFLLTSTLHIDINNEIFVNILHLTDDASYYRPYATDCLPSGLCWHPAFMAPVVVLSLAFPTKWYIKLIAIVDAVVCGNSTVLIVTIVYIVLYIVVYGVKRLSNHKVKQRTILILFALLIIGIPVAIKLGFFDTVITKIIYIYERSTGKIYDGGSATAHISYFTLYPQVIKNSSIFQLLFGYGPGCSGYAIDQIAHQYSNLKSWAVESDVMDLIYSRGIIGSIVYYAFLIKIIIGGYKIDKHYMILLISIILGGITYNIQFDWVIFIELCLWLSIKNKHNIFAIDI